MPCVVLGCGLLLLSNGHGRPVVAVPKEDKVVQGCDRGQHLLDERQNLGAKVTNLSIGTSRANFKMKHLLCSQIFSDQMLVYQREK